MNTKQNIVVAGAGTFGTAIAERLSWNKNNNVVLHSIEKEVITSINENHRNVKYFPMHVLSSDLSATDDFSVFATADVILLVIPSKAIVPFSEKIATYTKGRDPLVINLAKGMSEEGAFITEKIPFRRTASMKGPSFAIEVLNGIPTAFTFGGNRADYIEFKDKTLKDTGLYLDYTSNIRGVELMSILKNMYAIGIGLVSGRYNSPNVDFMIYTKCVNEMKMLLKLYDCDDSVIFKYCGIGDLGLTGLNDLSRNRTLGMLIGKGFTYDQNGSSATVVEGHRTIKLIGELTRQRQMEADFPIVQALYRLMYEGMPLLDYMVEVFR
jgi:Glycerol-3-phosphate dehydrogenase